MDHRETQSKRKSKFKLPMTADWWRDVDAGKGKISLAQSEYFESPAAELLPTDEQEVMTQRNTTIESSGEIDISNILFPIEFDTERQIYEKNCERLQCPTSRKFGKIMDNVTIGLHNDDINMAHYGLTSMGVRATAISLSNLSQCSVIDLQGNKLTSSSLSALVSVMKKCPVTEFNLSSTDISKFGPDILSQWISSSMHIKKLFLRDNKFDDSDGIKLFEAVASSRSLIAVDLAENLFCIRCGDALKKLLDENDILETLDLSWNHLRLNAAISIAKGLKNNNGIKTIILSWNGLEDLGAKELGLAFKDNDCLQQIELVCNRITDIGFKMFMKGIEKNTTLKTIKIGRNLISQATAEATLTSLGNGDLRDSAIDTLDFTNIIYKQSFQLTIDNVKVIRNGFTCLFGYEDCYGKRKMISYNPVREAFQFLKSYIEENNINFVELYQKFDVNGNMSVSYDEFRRGLKDASIPMSDEQISILIEYLDSDHDGEIDFSELVLGAEGQISRDKEHRVV